ncbi:iron chelate uptake ABC transporter family permease subunit [Streptomyces sp. ZL-24]|uniref:iron chelate uptake ABC transporter family permease subunit n=1 Tax=Streptomyces sp. ZL-24 TaxID=1933029 RepID=UPI001F4D9AC0|nr:iron chelate uptake ABC transporter family permease subunit [Streptomyces sp. ZL-24]
MLAGADHRWSLPLSMACGAILLIGADIAGRLVLGRGEIQVGVMTAVIGTRSSSGWPAAGIWCVSDGPADTGRRTRLRVARGDARPAAGGPAPGRAVRSSPSPS